MSDSNSDREPDAYRDTKGSVYINLRKHPLSFPGAFDADEGATPIWFDDSETVARVRNLELQWRLGKGTLRDFDNGRWWPAGASQLRLVLDPDDDTDVPTWGHGV
jgi:hypothetical protein